MMAHRSSPCRTYISLKFPSWFFILLLFFCKFSACDAAADAAADGKTQIRRQKKDSLYESQPQPQPHHPTISPSIASVLVTNAFVTARVDDGENNKGNDLNSGESNAKDENDNNSQNPALTGADEEEIPSSLSIDNMSFSPSKSPQLSEEMVEISISLNPFYFLLSTPSLASIDLNIIQSVTTNHFSAIFNESLAPFLKVDLEVTLQRRRFLRRKLAGLELSEITLQFQGEATLDKNTWPNSEENSTRFDEIQRGALEGENLYSFLKELQRNAVGIYYLEVHYDTPPPSNDPRDSESSGALSAEGPLTQNWILFLIGLITAVAVISIICTVILIRRRIRRHEESEEKTSRGKEGTPKVATSYFGDDFDVKSESTFGNQSYAFSMDGKNAIKERSVPRGMEDHIYGCRDDGVAFSPDKFAGSDDGSVWTFANVGKDDASTIQSFEMSSTPARGLRSERSYKSGASYRGGDSTILGSVTSFDSISEVPEEDEEEEEDSILPMILPTETEGRGVSDDSIEMVLSPPKTLPIAPPAVENEPMQHHFIKSTRIDGLDLVSGFLPGVVGTENYLNNSQSEYNTSSGMDSSMMTTPSSLFKHSHNDVVDTPRTSPQKIGSAPSYSPQKQSPITENNQVLLQHPKQPFTNSKSSPLFKHSHYDRIDTPRTSPQKNGSAPYSPQKQSPVTEDNQTLLQHQKQPFTSSKSSPSNSVNTEKTALDTTLSEEEQISAQAEQLPHEKLEDEDEKSLDSIDMPINHKHRSLSANRQKSPAANPLRSRSVQPNHKLLPLQHSALQTRPPQKSHFFTAASVPPIKKIYRPEHPPSYPLPPRQDSLKSRDCPFDEIPFDELPNRRSAHSKSKSPFPPIPKPIPSNSTSKEVNAHLSLEEEDVDRSSSSEIIQNLVLSSRVKEKDKTPLIGNKRSNHHSKENVQNGAIAVLNDLDNVQHTLRTTSRSRSSRTPRRSRR